MLCRQRTPARTTVTAMVSRCYVIAQFACIAVLAFCAGLAAAYGQWWRGIPFVALLLVLHFKARFEERALEARYPEYAAYARRTRRLIPGVI
jgi:protein-S-isoprenylcysteine O-methyltransferase Ste14